MEAELGRCVASFYPGATGVIGAAKLSGGASQETWSFDIVHPDGQYRRDPAPRAEGLWRVADAGGGPRMPRRG